MSSHDADTRAVYREIHSIQASDDVAKARMVDMMGGETFGLDPEWFVGQEVGDIGCGNLGVTIKRLLDLGVSSVVGVELGGDWVEPLEASLESMGADLERFSTRSGSILDIPLPDAALDLVVTNGVLLHLETIADAAKGFAECCRVCRPGGYLYMSLSGSGGLLAGVVFPAIRAHYRQNPAFRAYIDTLSAQKLHDTIDRMASISQSEGDVEIGPEFLKDLFGQDFVAFLKNKIAAPTWYSNELSPSWVEAQYAEQGFEDVRRLNRFVRRQDVRKYLAPLHFMREEELSSHLYGEGVPLYVGRKPG